MNRSQIEALLKRLQIHRKNLSIHLNQAAMRGVTSVPPATYHEIDFARQEIRKLKNSLRAYGVQVADEPNDEEPDDDVEGTSAPGQAGPPRADLVIVTAMREELEPVLGLFGGPAAWSTFQIDTFLHYAARAQVGGRELRLVACSLWKYGGDPTAAAVVRLKALAPRLIAMTGICAGWESKGINFGDVIVADRAFHAGEGKQTDAGFQADLRTYAPPPWLMQWLRDFSFDKEWRRAIQTPRPRSLRYQAMWLLCRMHERPAYPDTDGDWRELEAEQIDYPRAVDLLRGGGLLADRRTLTERALALLADLRERNYGRLAPLPDPPHPAVHYGAFASTEAIIAVESPFQEYAQRVRSVRAVELEVASLFAAAAEIGVPAFAVKGVSDYGTPDKDDAFHAYAAEASARWAEAFIRRYADQLPAS